MQNKLKSTNQVSVNFLSATSTFEDDSKKSIFQEKFRFFLTDCSKPHCVTLTSYSKSPFCMYHANNEVIL